MYTQNRNNIERHVKTHSQRSDEDRSAVTILETFLRANGKISTNFSKEDKWPNIDGTLEFVENPLITRRPKQNFFVQIKGTHLYTETDNGIKYSLKSLAFPAFIYLDVTLDPGLLFVVLNPDCRGEERVFWKYNTSDLEDSSRMNSIVPFQLAYAVSIHKAQGLEYDSVKVIIPQSNSEKITHGIFYTAITRAKKKLKIYWSAETMKEIVSGFATNESNGKSLEIVKAKLAVTQ